MPRKQVLTCKAFVYAVSENNYFIVALHNDFYRPVLYIIYMAKRYPTPTQQARRNRRASKPVIKPARQSVTVIDSVKHMPDMEPTASQIDYLFALNPGARIPATRKSANRMIRYYLSK